MKKLQQKSLDQTGAAILILGGNEEKVIPLFSLNPVEEANSLVEQYFPECEKIKAVYITNNLLDTKIEDLISAYKEECSALPEDYMEDLVSGFPFVFDRECEITKHFYL